MCDKNSIVLERQLAIRRELDRRGVPLKVVAFDAGIPYSTLVSYFPANPEHKPAIISGGAIFALCGAMPADLLSLLLPDGFQIVQVPESVDHDTLCELAQDYVATKQAAHRVDSPGGREIVTSEVVALDSKATALRAVS